MNSGVWLGLIVIAGFAVWGAVLFRRGRVEEAPERHETRRERRRQHNKS
jgi:hypothetical protein